MHIKAIFLDFYGTLVYEDDEIVSLICKEVCERAAKDCDSNEVGRVWWKEFTELFYNSYGETFKKQRELAINSLERTISYFKSDCLAESIIQKQFDHWRKPAIYDDSIPFLNSLNEYQVFILSNIDTSDVVAAASHHGITVNGIYTSEDVKSYKPRPELFLRSLEKNSLLVNEVIHIGDSYSSDIIGASDLGMKNIWLNRLNKKKPEGPVPTFISKDFKEVRNILSGIEEGSIVV